MCVCPSSDGKCNRGGGKRGCLINVGLVGIEGERERGFVRLVRGRLSGFLPFLTIKNGL